jgi:hypothetical protein
MEGERVRAGLRERWNLREGGRGVGPTGKPIEIPCNTLLHLVTPQGTFYYGRIPDRRSFSGRRYRIHSIFDLNLLLPLESVWGVQFSKAPKAMLIYTVFDGELKTIFPILYFKKFEYNVVIPPNARFSGLMAAFFSERTGMPTIIPLVEKSIDPFFHCCSRWESDCLG